ncbi:MAG: polyprenyl synthetase family protein [Flavobacteriales bacterium]
MSKLELIQAPIASEMEEFERFFKRALKSDNKLLDRVSHYIIRRKGKQMRPMFVFLTSKVCGGVTPSSYTAASMIELLHTATLVHDDVVDDAETRRGFFSVNALWKNKIAVLVGDYLLSRGLLMSIDSSEFNLLRIVSHAVREMSEGELLQQEKSRLLNITEEVYYTIIRQKTASLIAACCESGASAAGASSEMMANMRAFGNYVGLAFQIKDDLFDYGMGKNTGKATGIDIAERKMTLPLIYALNVSEPAVRRRLVNVVKNHNTSSEHVNWLLEQVIRSGGIDYARQKMKEFRDKALEILSTFADSEAKTALAELVHFTINREK